jgi:hypothetical protein
MSGAVLWAEAPDDDDERDETPDCEAHGDVDETFAARRLRRWIKGMFGGKPPAAELDDEPGRSEET